MTDARREPWTLVEALAAPDEESDQVAAQSVERYRAWTRPLEAVFIVDEDGGASYEARASNGTLRERDYRTEHQVLHVQADPAWAAQRATGPLGMDRQSRPSRDGLERLDLPTGTVQMRITNVDLASSPPTIMRVFGWTWEVYRHLGLRACSFYAAVALPRVMVGYEFDQGFVYTSSSSNSAALHVIWRSGESEIELVIANHEGVDAPSDGDCQRTTGTVRFADLYADDHRVVEEAAAALSLQELANVAQPMPSETSPWRWQWSGGRIRSQ